MATAFRELAAGLRFPEGPVAMRDGSVILVEIEGRRLTRIEPEGKRSTIATFGGSPNGAAIGPDGKCYVCNSGGLSWQEDELGLRPTGEPEDYSGGRIERVDLATGRIERLYDRVGAEPIRGPNDLVFDAHGGFYFTDPGKTRARDQDRGCVCYATADGRSIRQVIFPISRPNGIGLSPDGKTLYVAETETARLWSWRIEAPGELVHVPFPSTRSPHGGTLVYASPTYQRFDSLAVEASGRVCVGTLDAGCVTVVDPSSGAAEIVKVPQDTHITNLCFGGADRRTAFITCSYAGVLVEAAWPRPGLALAH